MELPHLSDSCILTWAAAPYKMSNWRGDKFRELLSVRADAKMTLLLITKLGTPPCDSCHVLPLARSRERSTVSKLSFTV